MNGMEISFIIPTLNEQKHIGAVLEAIEMSVNGRLKYEVLVVDNGSHDRTMEIAEEHNATCLEAFNCSISSVRNFGAEHSEADIMVFLDADVYLTNDWGMHIKEVIARVQRQHDIITGSFCGISTENNWIEKIWFAPRTATKEAVYMNSGHLIVHKDMFTRLGGFAPELETGEDCDFCLRASQLGGRIENDAALKVVHAGYPKSVQHFFARERWHGRGDYRSIKALVSSKPAMISLANLCMIITCSIGVIYNRQAFWTYVGIYVLFIAGVSTAAAIHRCHGNMTSSLFGTTFLYMIYITARSVAMIDMLVQSITVRRPLRATG